MYYNYSKKNFLLKSFILLLVIVCILSCFKINNFPCLATPFYDLQPQNIVLRSKFYTSFSSSSEDRKSNIKTAALALDKTLVEAGAEFSFNKTVGARTEERGYKNSKIIVGGEFVDGIGGGVCQVSTTLYNAVLLSGLEIIEFHPHSLAVSYVSPSFDAMVSYNFADLRFINNTHNPIILHTITTDNTITIEIYGEKSEYSYSRQSVKIEDIPAPQELEVMDEKGDFPDLYEGQKKVVRYSKAGLKSQGFLIKSKNGKVISTKKLRSDTYSATRGLIVWGTVPTPFIPEENQEETKENISLIDFLRNILNKQKIL